MLTSSLPFSQKQLGLPLKGSSIISEGFKAGDRPHLETATAHLQNFGERLFQAGFLRRTPASPTSNGAKASSIALETYVNTMKILNGTAAAARLEFLLDLYTANSDRDHLTYGALNSLLREAVALHDALHAKEESQILEFAYCVLDEPEEVSSPSADRDSGFAPVKAEPKPDTKTAPKRSKAEDIEIEVIVPPKEKVSAENYNMNIAVPKHNVEDLLPSQEDNEAKLMKEVLEMREADRSRSKQIEAYSNTVINSILSAIFKDCGVDLSSQSSAANSDSSQQEASIEFDRVKSWFTSNFHKISDSLLALVRLNVSGRLQANAPELEKKNYKRVAPLPDGVMMHHSNLWTPTMIWTMHQYFNLKNIGSFKLLYSSTQHGRSLNRYIHHVIGYKAESLFLVTTTKGEIFGAYVATPWDTSSSFWSNSNCYLFGISPVLSIRHTQASGPANYVYFFSNKKSFTGKPVGIGFGGSTGNFRLWIDEDLMTGTVRSMDPSYEMGAIAANPAFDIASIEVWGSCTDYAEAGLLRERRLREKDSERARKAAGKDGWNEGADKFIMDLMGRTGHSEGVVEANEAVKRERAAHEAQLAAAAAKLDAMESGQK